MKRNTTIHQEGGQEHNYDMNICNLLWLHNHCSPSWDGWDVTWPMFVYSFVWSQPSTSNQPLLQQHKVLRTIYQSGSYYSPKLQCIPPDMYLLKLEFSTWWHACVGIFQRMELFPWTQRNTQRNTQILRKEEKKLSQTITKWNGNWKAGSHWINTPDLSSFTTGGTENWTSSPYL